MKILSVFGTRPEAIKMAPVIARLAHYQDRLTSVVCVTAQHREMLDQVLQLFAIHPDYDLGLMRPDQTLAEITARAFTRLDEVLQQEKPDWILVQGDTTTAMVAALAAFYRRLKVGHVEAGLRSFDKYQPFPEEMNRKIVSQVSELHFAPTEVSRRNLLAEGIPATQIAVTGNPVIDALLQTAQMPYRWEASPLATIPRDKKLILVTAHRRENFGDPLRNICAALREIARRHPEVHLVFPVHRNPQVRQVVEELLGDVSHLTLLDPLEYLPLVKLLQQAYLVVTDSGGLQEEAPSLGKPVLVLREVTERPEGVSAGTVKLVGTASQKIIGEIETLLTDQTAYGKMGRAQNPYGDGQAAEKIVARLLAEPPGG